MTVLTPILDGRESSLARCLDSLGDGPSSPLSRVPGTHLARWVIIGDVVYEGAGQRRVDHLTQGRLLFSSNFDGGILPYLERLRAGLGDVADAIWGHCVGYPGIRTAKRSAPIYVPTSSTAHCSSLPTASARSRT